MKINLKGISLIVLVITIIVMIIIAGAIILSLNSSNIVSKAKEGVRDSNLKEVQSAANLVYAELKLEKPNIEPTGKEISKKLIEKGIIKKTDYTISNNANGLNISKTDPFIFKINVEQAGNTKILELLTVELFLSLGADIKDTEKTLGTLDINYDFNIDYGDGNQEYIDFDYAIDNTSLRHQYASAGEYTIKIEGTCGIIYKNNACADVNEIISWGNIGVKTFLFDGNYTTFPPTTEETFKNAIIISFALSDNFTTIPNDLFKNCNNLKSVQRLFSGSKITSIPPDLFKECPNINNFEEAFEDCTLLQGQAPELWLKYPGTIGNKCFKNCLGLSNYDEIPIDWKD